MAWYCVRTEKRSESLAKKGIEAIFSSVYLPMFLARIAHAGQVTHEHRILFPRYLFVNFDLSQSWRRINRTRGVEYLIVSQAERPIEVPDREIEAVKLTVREHDAAAKKKIKSPYSIGQTLRVTGGPFTSFDGVCEKTEIDRVNILLDIFGRKTPIEIQNNFVEARA